MDHVTLMMKGRNLCIEVPCYWPMVVDNVLLSSCALNVFLPRSSSAETHIQCDHPGVFGVQPVTAASGV